ncbi:MerR family transcriptional regulator [Microbacterium sp. CIAB417]|uniref:MerR family transcriptional regulator n=1 Tax=Microbacterium sp. CIAB417 TaxID=2860287 RepID=UPI001FAE08C6|nr:MerR family transcriptional regulator [Microbacterium sp. CIAB417]
MDVNTPASMTPWLRPVAQDPVPLSVDEHLTVGEVASMVGVSVRTLHHWDNVGLMRPESRTTSGYRAYSAADVARVHRVLVYQELGFGLTQIAAILDDPTVDESAQLREQRGLLEDRIRRLRQMADAIDRVLDSQAAGIRLTAQQQAEIFGSGWREDWADAARQRWGESDEWLQFERNAMSSSESDRKRMQEQGEALYAEMAEAKRSGVEPGTESANLLAEQHRMMVSQLFDCTHSMQVCLGRTYAGDERFSAFFAEREPGLAAWLAEVINANARRHGVDPDNAAWE